MKFSKYNIPVDVENGVILYNTKNSEYVNIFNEPDLSEFRRLLELSELPADNKIVQILYSRGYVVDNDTDEYEQAKNRVKACLEERKKSIYIVLYVTDNCNFRCVYCPQVHKNSFYTDNSWNALYKYLEKNVQNNTFNSISMSFFGGEPLLRSKQIVEFLTKIQKLKIQYNNLTTKFYMTTNGYLLSPDLYSKLSELGLLEFQITLDGFASTHDKTRFLADGSPTWDTITKNLDYINTVNDNVKIRLRANINSNNIDSIKTFLQWIDNRYNKEKFRITLQPVSKVNDNVADEYVQNSESINEAISELKEKSERDVDNNTNFLTTMGLSCRYAKNYITISSSADIYKCEYVYFDEVKPIGTLDDNGNMILYKNYKDWTEDFEIDECKDCTLYPLCAARYCPKNKVLDKQSLKICLQKRDKLISTIKQSIRKGILTNSSKTKN